MHSIFFSDAANYIVSLFVVGRAPDYRAKASLLKGFAMAYLAYGFLASRSGMPCSEHYPKRKQWALSVFSALISNAAVFGMLWAYRSGDSNMRSVWICSRNPVVGNLAVLLAALGVFGTGTGWPDVIVAAIIAGLSLQGAWQIVGHARVELHDSLSPREERMPLVAIGRAQSNSLALLDRSIVEPGLVKLPDLIRAFRFVLLASRPPRRLLYVRTIPDAEGRQV